MVREDSRSYGPGVTEETGGLWKMEILDHISLISRNASFCVGLPDKIQDTVDVQPQEFLQVKS